MNSANNNPITALAPITVSGLILRARQINREKPTNTPPAINTAYRCSMAMRSLNSSGQRCPWHNGHSVQFALNSVTTLPLIRRIKTTAPVNRVNRERRSLITFLRLACSAFGLKTTTDAKDENIPIIIKSILKKEILRSADFSVPPSRV